MLLRLALVALVLALAACAAKPPQASAPAPAAQVPADEDDPLFNAVAGEFALEQGDLPGAAAYLVRAAELSEDTALAERAAWLALTVRDRALAARAVARWTALAPEAPGPLQARAMLALQTGDLPAAREALAALLARPAPSGWMAAVQALAHGGEEARRVLAELAGAGRLPEEARALVVFSQLARRLDDAGLALELAERARRSAPRDEQAALWAAELRRQQGDRAAARAILEAARAELPGSEPVLLALAGLLAEDGRFVEAQDLLATAGASFEVQRMRAAVAARAGDPVEIRRLYEELREDSAFRAHPRATLLLGELAELARRHEEALAWYRQVPADGEDHEEAVRRIALVLAAEGRLEEARALLPRIGEEDPAARALFEHELLLRAGRPEEALARIERGLEAAPEERSLLYARGLVLERLDRLEEAIATFRRLVELDPEDPNALNALGYTLADRTDRLAEAHELIRRALEARPEEPAFIDSMGWVLFRMGRAAEALPYLERAFALQPDAEVAAHLGEVLWTLGERERARAIWERGRDLDPGHRVLRATLQRLLGEE